MCSHLNKNYIELEMKLIIYFFNAKNKKINSKYLKNIGNKKI